MDQVIRSSGRCHAVRFYESEKSLAKIVAGFLADGAREGAPGIVVATATQRAAILRALVTQHVDVVSLTRSGDLVLLDAATTLSSFLTDGEIDARAFEDRLSDVIRTVQRGREDCTVRIYGQMVDVLWQEGRCELAIRLETLWNRLGRTRTFSLLCGYSMGAFYKDADVDRVCAQHTHRLAADGTARDVA